MRFHPLIPALAICALVIFVASSLHLAYAQEFVQYKVQVNVDGSASWTITQASSLNGTIDSWKGFQQRVTDLVTSASNQTQRTMGVDANSLQLNTIWENQSQTTEYQFTWLNFSVVQGNRIVFGDVFQANGFFNKLYGDGELQIVYPLNYTLSSVFPQPNGDNTAPHTLDWLGTDFFVKGNPSIVLLPSAPSPSPNQTADFTGWPVYATIGSGTAIAVVALSVGFYLFRRNRSQKTSISPNNLPLTVPIVESEEGKILKALQASGGSAYQSALTDQCRFSKSKTSQLLTALEKSGVVRRYKKGRDKIVTLSEQSKTKGEFS
jgi:uncharacterized membrane protein